MAVVVVRDPLSGKDFSASAEARMYLYAEGGGISLALPVAPRDITVEGIGSEWVEVERTGAAPLLLRKGGRLKTLSFSAWLTSKVDMFQPQAGPLAALEALAETRERVLVRYGPQEAGLWRVTDVSYSSELRHPVTNEITRAMLTVTLKRASDPAPAVGPVSGGTRPSPAAAPQPAPQRVHTVVKGDCLWKLAQRYYQRGTLWPRIFDANRTKIKDPHWIYPGQVFIIP